MGEGGGVYGGTGDTQAAIGAWFAGVRVVFGFGWCLGGVGCFVVFHFGRGRGCDGDGFLSNRTSFVIVAYSSVYALGRL